MNYSNHALRLASPKRLSEAAGQTILSLETDKRGTHLRARKVSTVLQRHRRLLTTAAVVLLLGNLAPATLSIYQPDAWTRGNTSTTSYFGWDVFEASGIVLASGTNAIDDTTPDVGLASGLSSRLYQGAGTAGNYGSYGHRSGSGNYYSGFNPTNFMDDTIKATSPGAAGGYTTVVLQLLSTANSANAGLAFTISGAAFTLQKSLYSTDANGTGQYWTEWTAPGANISYSIDLDSSASSVGIDSFTVDTKWTNGASPTVNNIAAVPEPTTAALLGGLGLLFLAKRRERARVAR